MLNWSLRICGSGSACDLFCSVYHTVHSPSGLSTCLFIVAQPKLDVIPICGRFYIVQFNWRLFPKGHSWRSGVKRAPRKCYPLYITHAVHCALSSGDLWIRNFKISWMAVTWYVDKAFCWKAITTTWKQATASSWAVLGNNKKAMLPNLHYTVQKEYLIILVFNYILQFIYMNRFTKTIHNFESLNINWGAFVICSIHLPGYQVWHCHPNWSCSFIQNIFFHSELFVLNEQMSLSGQCFTVTL